MEGILYFLPEILRSLAITEQTKILKGTNYALFSWWVCPETFCEVLAYFLPSTRWLSRLPKQTYLFGFKAKQNPKFQQPPNYCHSCSVSPLIVRRRIIKSSSVLIWQPHQFVPQLTAFAFLGSFIQKFSWTSITVTNICFIAAPTPGVWLCLYYVLQFALLWFPF